MDKKIDGPNADVSPVSRKVEIPIWILAIMAILLVVALLQFCSSNPQIDGTPPSQTNIPTDPTSRPENAKMCDGTPEQYVCVGLHNYTFTLTNVPDDTAPYLLPILANEESQLRDLPKDGVGCVVSIAGNLVFYDNNNNLFTSFPDPVTLELHYTDNDEQFLTLFNQPESITALKEANYDDKLIECVGSLKENGVDEIELVPIYLYTPTIEGYSDIHVWKPFQNFSIDEAGRTMTIEFLYWGDQQIGGGTRP